MFAIANNPGVKFHQMVVFLQIHTNCIVGHVLFLTMQHGLKLSVVNNFKNLKKDLKDAVFVSCHLMFSHINEKGIYNNAYTLYRPPRNAERAKQQQRQ